MSNDLKVSAPIEVKDDCAERVAFDLMVFINNDENPHEGNPCAAKKASKRLYYLNLYIECLNVVKGCPAPERDSSL